MFSSGGTTLAVVEAVVALGRIHPHLSAEALLEHALHVPSNEPSMVFVELRPKPDHPVELYETFTRQQWAAVNHELARVPSLMLEYGTRVFSFKTAVGAIVECKAGVYRRLTSLRPCTLISDALRTLCCAGKLDICTANAEIIWPGRRARKRLASNLSDEPDPPRKEMLPGLDFL